MTPSNGNIFHVTGLLCGEFTGRQWFPRTKPVTRSFNVVFDLHLNQELSKQWRRRWFETPSPSLWRHWNVWDGNSQATSGYDAVTVLRLVRNAVFRTFYIVFFVVINIWKRNDIYSPCLRPGDCHSVVPWAAFSYISQYQPFVGAMFHLIFPVAILAWSTSQTDRQFQIAIFRGNSKRRGKSHMCVRSYPRVADNIYVVWHICYCKRIHVTPHMLLWTLKV